MAKGHPPPEPEWLAICALVRHEFTKVCPLSNRRFSNEPGTFRRTQIADITGVSMANMRRLVDNQLPCDPDTVLGLAKFLGLSPMVQHVAPLPVFKSSKETRSPRRRAGRTRRKTG